jgi:hypothetical protein
MSFDWVEIVDDWLYMYETDMMWFEVVRIKQAYNKLALSVFAASVKHLKI